MTTYPDWLKDKSVREGAVLIYDWGTNRQRGNGYTAPECLGACLTGAVRGHPKFPDGHRIDTSAIVDTWHRYVLCRSRVYRLGRVDPLFLERLRELGRPYDPYVPLKV